MCDVQSSESCMGVLDVPSRGNAWLNTSTLTIHKPILSYDSWYGMVCGGVVWCEG